MTRILRPLVAAISTAVLLLGFAGSAAAASITLQWDANTEPDITGYIVSYGTRSGVYDHQLDVGKTTTAVISLASTGSYYFVVYAYSPQGMSDPSQEVSTAILPTNPFLAIDTPSPSATTTSAFEVGGWALDAGAGSGTGVDTVVFYVFPNAGAAPGVYIGQGSYGWSRADVGAIFGSRFTNSGYHFTITGLGPGAYLLGVYAHSTVTGSYSIVRTSPFNVSSTALMSIDVPGAEAVVTSPTFAVSGWSLDRQVESTAQAGTGVDMLHVYAYPSPGSGLPPIFLGVATTGIARPDLAAIFGPRYSAPGYTLQVGRAALGLAPGVYNIVVHSHSTVTGAFNNVALVRVTLQ
jgi:hypothetical protein